MTKPTSSRKPRTTKSKANVNTKSSNNSSTGGNTSSKADVKVTKAPRKSSVVSRKKYDALSKNYSETTLANQRLNGIVRMVSLIAEEKKNSLWGKGEALSDIYNIIDKFLTRKESGK